MPVADKTFAIGRFGSPGNGGNGALPTGGLFAVGWHTVCDSVNYPIIIARFITSDGLL